MVHFYILLVSLSISLFNCQVSTFPESILKKIDDFVTESMQCERSPAVSLSVVKLDAQNQPTVLTKGYGRKQFNTPTSPVTEKTVFCLGPLTKAFTSVLLGLYVQSGILSWDDNVQYLLKPHFPQLFASEALNELTTVKDLLAQRLNFPEYPGMQTVGFSTETRDQLLASLHFLDSGNDSSLYANFRSDYVKSNLAFVIAAVIAEKKSPEDIQNWENLLQRYVFKPLAMGNTFFGDIGTETYFRNLASSVVYENGLAKSISAFNLKNIKPFGPAKSICSSAKDMAYWLFYLASKGSQTPTLHSIASEQTLEQLWSPKTPHSFIKRYKNSTLSSLLLEDYAMGWRVGSYAGYRLIQDSGSVLGYHSAIWTFPDEKLGVFSSISGSLRNSAQFNDRLNEFISSLLLPDVKAISSGFICDSIQPRTSQPVCECSPVTDKTFVNTLPGNYTHYVLGDIQISTDNGSKITLSYGKSGFAQLCNARGSYWLSFNFPTKLWYPMCPSQSRQMSNRIVFHKNSYNEIVGLSAAFIQTVPTVPYFEDNSKTTTTTVPTTYPSVAKGCNHNRAYRLWLLMIIIMCYYYVN